MKRRRHITPEQIAFWQFLVYLMLLLLIWVNEFFDFSHFIYGTARRSIDIVGACLLSAFVLTTAVINIGHTYLTQAEMLHGLITICSRCRKVRIDEHSWSGIEDYLGKYARMDFTHGLCPECYNREMRELDASVASVSSAGKTNDGEKSGNEASVS